MLAGGCFVEGSVDERGDAVCRSQGIVVFRGRIRMTGESIIDVGELPTSWRIAGEDVECDILLDVRQVE
jgi:hypothetical protein